MDRISEEIAVLVKQDPKAWRHEYQRRTGQRFDRLEDGPEADAKRKNAEQVWALLDEIAAQMLPVPAQAAG